MCRPPANNVPGRGPRTDLALHVHDDHRVGAVAHHKVFGVLGQQEDVVDRDVGARRRAQRFESVGALGGLHVPNLVPEHTRQARHTLAHAPSGLTGKRGEKRKRRTPYLDGPVRRSADDVVTVGGEGGLVHKRRVATELLQCLSRLQPVNSASENSWSDASKQEVINVTEKGHFY